MTDATGAAEATKATKATEGTGASSAQTLPLALSAFERPQEALSVLEQSQAALGGL